PVLGVRAPRTNPASTTLAPRFGRPQRTRDQPRDPPSRPCAPVCALPERPAAASFKSRGRRLSLPNDPLWGFHRCAATRKERRRRIWRRGRKKREKEEPVVAAPERAAARTADHTKHEELKSTPSLLCFLFAAPSPREEKTSSRTASATTPSPSNSTPRLSPHRLDLPQALGEQQDPQKTRRSRTSSTTSTTLKRRARTILQFVSCRLGLGAQVRTR
ncbi:unnamed protein product, partial [Urochloa humidicola]